MTFIYAASSMKFLNKINQFILYGASQHKNQHFIIFCGMIWLTWFYISSAFLSQLRNTEFEEYDLLYFATVISSLLFVHRYEMKRPLTYFWRLSGQPKEATQGKNIHLKLHELTLFQTGYNFNFSLFCPKPTSVRSLKNHEIGQGEIIYAEKIREHSVSYIDFYYNFWFWF